MILEGESDVYMDEDPMDIIPDLTMDAAFGLRSGHPDGKGGNDGILHGTITTHHPDHERLCGETGISRNDRLDCPRGKNRIL